MRPLACRRYACRVLRAENTLSVPSLARRACACRTPAFRAARREFACSQRAENTPKWRVP
eukprot:12536098-Alexandrium_andersonii.AAC.1